MPDSINQFNQLDSGNSRTDCFRVSISMRVPTSPKGPINDCPVGYYCHLCVVVVVVVTVGVIIVHQSAEPDSSRDASSKQYHRMRGARSSRVDGRDIAPHCAKSVNRGEAPVH